MRSSDQGDGALIVTAVFIGLALLGGGGVILMRQRQQTLVLMQRARAEAARAEAIAQLQRAEAARAEAIAQQQLVESIAARSIDDAKSESGMIDAEIRQLLNEHAEAWNESDIQRYLNLYQRSDELVVVRDGRVARSWNDFQRHLEQSGFGEGELTFSEPQIHPLSNDAVQVVSNFQIDGGDRDASGFVTMMLRKTEGQGTIVHEHRSNTVTE